MLTCFNSLVRLAFLSVIQRALIGAIILVKTIYAYNNRKLKKVNKTEQLYSAILILHQSSKAFYNLILNYQYSYYNCIHDFLRTLIV